MQNPKQLLAAHHAAGKDAVGDEGAGSVDEHACAVGGSPIDDSYACGAAPGTSLGILNISVPRKHLSKVLVKTLQSNGLWSFVACSNLCFSVSLRREQASGEELDVQLCPTRTVRTQDKSLTTGFEHP